MSNSAKKDECQPYRFFIKDQLKNYMKPETDSKLQTFAKCYEEFKNQPYLNNNFPKSMVKHLTKLRISSHTLLIEKGRYIVQKSQET